jgi:DNA polymerase III subunit delta
MIARHYRQLIQLKAMQAEGARPPEIARALGIFEWKMGGLANQANLRSFGRLEAAMEKILAADEAIKTGQMSDREAMDVLLAELIDK